MVFRWLCSWFGGVVPLLFFCLSGCFMVFEGLWWVVLLFRVVLGFVVDFVCVSFVFLFLFVWLGISACGVVLGNCGGFVLLG